MTANDCEVSNNDDAAKNLLKNLTKLRQTKTFCLEEENEVTNDSVGELHHKSESEITNKPFKRRIVWKLFIRVFLGHIMAAYALYPLCFEVSWACVVYCLALSVWVNGVGAVIAAHRYYSHRSFKANLPLQIIMIIAQSMSVQGAAFYWTRNHRLHHKYSDTDADPHNASRGFFFSHMGWIVVTRHPMIAEKIEEINVSDLQADKVVMFQKRHYYKMLFFFALLLPTLVPVYCFGDTWWNSFLISVCLRTFLVHHASYSINSWAHHYGTKPYDQNIRSVETVLVSILASGDGWHNYHHTFPCDYKASEYGAPFNLGARMIEMFAYIGWATDLKVVTPEMVAARAARTGDGNALRNPPET